MGILKEFCHGLPLTAGILTLEMLTHRLFQPIVDNQVTNVGNENIEIVNKATNLGVNLIII